MICTRLLALSLSCVLVTLLSSCATTGGPDTCSLEGVVLDQQSGEPVAGVNVALGALNTLQRFEKPVVPYGGGKHPYVSTTGRDGTFRFQRLKPGLVLLMTEDKKLACVEGEVPVELGAGESKMDITLHVTEGASISGTIYNDGYYHGVGGVTVQAVPAYGHRKEWLRAYETVTNSDGTFYLGGIPSGNFDIRSSPMDGFQQTSVCFYGETPIAQSFTPSVGVELDWATHAEPFEFTVAPGALAQGMVVDESGQPVAGAGVYGSRGRFSEEPDVLTDEKGVFTLPDWERSKFPTLQARKDNALSEVLTSEKSLAEYGPIRLVLHPKASILVRLLGENGETLSVASPAYVSLDLLINGGKSMGGEAKNLTESWTYDLLLPAVQYQITVDGNEGLEILDSPQIVTTEAGKQTEVVFKGRKIDVRQGPRIVGKIVDAEGAPVADAILSDGASDSYQTVSSMEGAFEFMTRTLPKPREGVATPELQAQKIRVTASGFATLDISLRPGEAPSVIALERVGLIRGQVVDASTGRAVEDYLVTAYQPTDASSTGKAGLEQLTSTKLEKLPGGHFLLKGVAVSPIVLEVASHEYETARETLAFAPRIEEGLANFRLRRTTDSPMQSVAKDGTIKTPAHEATP